MPPRRGGRPESRGAAPTRPATARPAPRPSFPNVWNLFHYGAQRDRIAFAMSQTSTMPSSRMRSKCRSFVTRTARSCRHVAAWRTSAGSGVVMNRRQTARKVASTRTNRVFSISAATSCDAVSERRASAYRSISSSKRSFPTSAMSSLWRTSRRSRSVAVSLFGCFTAATKTFVSSKKVRVPAAGKGLHLLPDLPDDRVHVLPGEFLLQPTGDGLHVHFLKHQAAVLADRDEELRPLVDPQGISDRLGQHHATGAIHRNELRHRLHNMP